MDLWQAGNRPPKRPRHLPPGICEIHRRFCSLLPDDLLWITNPDGSRIPVLPGEFRTTQVAVGRHVAIIPAAVPRFMERFEEAYAGLGAIDAIDAAATRYENSS